MQIVLDIPVDREEELLQAFGESYGNGTTPLTEAELIQQLKDYLNNTVVAAALARELDAIRAERTIEIAERKVTNMNIPKVID
jgi:hypothetical protein